MNAVQVRVRTGVHVSTVLTPTPAPVVKDIREKTVDLVTYISNQVKETEFNDR